METNVSRSEQLSLAAAIIASPDPARISRLPLAERAGEQILRQIDAGASHPLWPQCYADLRSCSLRARASTHSV